MAALHAPSYTLFRHTGAKHLLTNTEEKSTALRVQYVRVNPRWTGLIGVLFHSTCVCADLFLQSFLHDELLGVRYAL